MPNVVLPSRPDTRRTFERMAQFVGRAVAMRFIGMKSVKTKYGVTRAALVDTIVHGEGFFPEQLCFWSIIKKQVVDAKGSWVVGILDVDDTHEGKPYLIDADLLPDEQKEDLFALIDEYDPEFTLQDGDESDTPF